MRKTLLAASLFLAAAPAYAQPVDPVADLKGQWQAAMVVGVGNVVKSLDALIIAYQAAQAAVAQATAKASYWEDACRSTPDCGGK